MDNSKQAKAQKSPSGSSSKPQKKPAASSVSAMHPPYGSAALKPKKKVGLIVGIISGVLILILAIAAALLYFLWWQNPQKIVTDAVVNTMTTKKALVNGKMTVIANNDSKIELNIKSAADSPKTKTDVEAKITLKNVSKTVNLKAAVVTDQDGAIYIKLNGVRDLVKSVVSLAIDANIPSSTYEASPSLKQQVEAVKKQIISQLEEKMSKIDGKWLKTTAEDIANSNTDIKCSAEIVKKLQNDSKARKEIADIYRQNSFLIIKDTKLDDRNGGRGFEIDLNSDEAAAKAKDFSKALENTSIGKDIKNCTKDVRRNNGSANKTGKSNGTLKIWADVNSHALKAVEIKGNSSDSSANLSLDIDTSKTESIDIPSNAASLKSVVEELFKGMSSSSVSQSA